MNKFPRGQRENVKTLETEMMSTRNKSKMSTKEENLEANINLVPSFIMYEELGNESESNLKRLVISHSNCLLLKGT